MRVMGMVSIRAYRRSSKKWTTASVSMRQDLPSGPRAPIPTGSPEVHGHEGCFRFSWLEILLLGSTFAAPNHEFLIVRSRGRISISEKKAASVLALMLTLSRRDSWVQR